MNGLELCFCRRLRRPRASRDRPVSPFQLPRAGVHIAKLFLCGLRPWVPGGEPTCPSQELTSPRPWKRPAFQKCRQRVPLMRAMGPAPLAPGLSRNQFHPTVRPRFCTSSHSCSGLKYSTIARVERSSPVASRSTRRQSRVPPWRIIAARNLPASLRFA